MTDGITTAHEGGVLTLTLDRPGTLNALTAEATDRLAAELEESGSRDDVRVVVLTGTGRAFCSGADLSGADAHRGFDSSSLDRANRVVRAITSSAKPCVAAVNGVAAGVGCSIAAACDLVVAARSASFSLAFTRIGLMPDGGATAVVAASVGRVRAMRMALLGEVLPAREAYDAGLVSHLVADDDLGPTVRGLAEQLAAGAPLAHEATKKAINAASLHRLEDALEREKRGQSVLLRTADVAEGMRAFGEKRPPLFRGE